MRLESVVLGIDFDPESHAVARWAVRHLVPQGELVLAHCLEFPTVPRFLQDLLVPWQVTVEEARREAKQRLEALASELRPHTIRTETRVGRPPNELAGLANEVGADWVVVGPHRRRHGLWGLLGSTAEQLVHSAQRPVLVARGLPADAPLRVLAPVDGSPLTPHVLRWGRFLAERFGAELHALHVVHVELLERASLLSPEVRRDEVEERFGREARRWLEEELRDAGVNPERAHTHVAIGEATGEIVSAAQRVGADLIVIGREGLGVAGRARAGRVASAVLRATACAVLLVPAPLDRPRAA